MGCSALPGSSVRSHPGEAVDLVGRRLDSSRGSRPKVLGDGPQPGYLVRTLPALCPGVESGRRHLALLQKRRTEECVCRHPGAIARGYPPGGYANPSENSSDHGVFSQSSLGSLDVYARVHKDVEKDVEVPIYRGETRCLL